MPGRALIVAAVIALALLAAACGTGSGGIDAAAARTIEIEMRDIAFSPDRVTVNAGERVRFVFRNTGQAVHDAYIGDEARQAEHEKEMGKSDGHGGHGDNEDEDAITVDPGETGELSHTFRVGEVVLIGCHQPGHYAAGMKLAVDVA